eukprot:3182881-Rhodomonas_salina.1
MSAPRIAYHKKGQIALCLPPCQGPVDPKCCLTSACHDMCGTAISRGSTAAVQDRRMCETF